MDYKDQVDVNVMKGLTLKSVHVSNDSDQIVFITTDGQAFLLHHEPDCCECVEIEDICGDLDDLIGSPLINAEEVSNYHEAFTLLVPHTRTEEEDESYTWTYYKFDTAKGGVTIRWYGTSNGYYSESVECFRRTEENFEKFKQEVSFIPTDILNPQKTEILTV